MALDTQAKRLSMIGFGMGPRLSFPMPDDGAIESGDRMHLLGLYAGFVGSAVLTIGWKLLAFRFATDAGRQITGGGTSTDGPAWEALALKLAHEAGYTVS